MKRYRVTLKRARHFRLQDLQATERSFSRAGAFVYGYTCYPQEFFDAIDRGYTRDEAYREIVIYRSRIVNPGL
jgi:hypothetical protein